ncbi:MAG: 16S rRNA (uracil(1498)-N(3))-methyltransferase [Candidimonas sp.]|nr:MAG: 16S rRNA (uracil(1498)-N(3))-methyltransferase [Candidimonas sp.]TAM21646.1 MAG: 16S rRNA (uracil(1498)-N(3))-methyltransferase [Candidimonas sp.]TAM79947.1 MAG: 16S rRNA (uracil(1498)-N(3))-methyltransferase [Candidimonas sp.]
MVIPRFYCLCPLAAHQRIELPEQVAHHALRVLRLGAGAEIVLFDGQGGEYPASLQIEGKKGYAQLGELRLIDRELPGAITLAQGIPSGDKMDWIVEKAVELGAQLLIPIAAQRSVLQLSGERLEKRLRRWAGIAQAASEQCGRNRIMSIATPLSLQACLEQTDASAQILFCDPDATQTLAQALRPDNQGLTLLIGPEGGWSEEEQAVAKRHTLGAVQFGKRIFRTETAGLALIAACSALKGWM